MTRLVERCFYYSAVAAVYCFLLLPLVFIVAVSVNGGAIPSFPPTDLSLHWYGQALTNNSFVQGALTSGWLALLAMVVSTPVGVAAALGVHRGNFRGKVFLETLFLAPLAVPGIVIGISLLVAFVAADLREAPMRLIAAHILMVLPYSIRTVLASWHESTRRSKKPR